MSETEVIDITEGRQVVVPIKNDTVKYIMDNPLITIDELVVLTGKSRRTITRYIKQLQEEGRLKRVGVSS